jgi:hypothetical protein
MQGGARPTHLHQLVDKRPQRHQIVGGQQAAASWPRASPCADHQSRWSCSGGGPSTGASPGATRATRSGHGAAGRPVRAKDAHGRNGSYHTQQAAMHGPPHRTSGQPTLPPRTNTRSASATVVHVHGHTETLRHGGSVGERHRDTVPLHPPHPPPNQQARTPPPGTAGCTAGGTTGPPAPGWAPPSAGS